MYDVASPKLKRPATRRPSVKALLIEKGINLVDIARALKVSSPTVSKVVSGKARSKRVQEAIAAALGLNIADLWPAAGEKP